MVRLKIEILFYNIANEEIIQWRTDIGYPLYGLDVKPVFDRQRDRYLLMVNGLRRQKKNSLRAH